MTATELQALLDAGRRVDLAEPVALDRSLYLSGADDRITLVGRGDATAFRGATVDVAPNGPGLVVIPRAFRFNADGTPRNLAQHFVDAPGNKYGFRTLGKAVLSFPGSAAALGPTSRATIAAHGRLGYGTVRQLQVDAWAEADWPTFPQSAFCGVMGDQDNPSPWCVGHNDGNSPWLLLRLADGRRQVFRWYVPDPTVRERLFSFRADLDGGQVGLSIDGGPYQWQPIPGWTPGETLWPYYGGPFQVGGVVVYYQGGQRFAPPDVTFWGLRVRTDFSPPPQSPAAWAIDAARPPLFQLVPWAPPPGTLTATCCGLTGWGQGLVQVVDPAFNDATAVECDLRDLVFEGNGDAVAGACLLAATCRGGRGLSVRDCRFTSYAFGVLALPLAGFSYPVRLEHVVCEGQWGAGVDLTGTGWATIDDLTVYHPARHALRGADGGGFLRDFRVAGGGGNGVQTLTDAVRFENFNMPLREAAFDFEDGSAPPRRSYVYAERCATVVIEDSDGGVPAGVAEVVLGPANADGSGYRVERSFGSTPKRVQAAAGWVEVG